MSQKLFRASTTNANGDDVDFNLIAGDPDEALGLFVEHCRGTFIDDEEVADAIGAGKPMQALILGIHDTGMEADALPSRVIPWEEISRDNRAIPAASDEDEAPEPGL